MTGGICVTYEIVLQFSIVIRCTLNFLIDFKITNNKIISHNINPASFPYHTFEQLSISDTV